MAGGKGTRLGRGEKPLLSVAGTPMIKRVLIALQRAHLGPIYVAVTDQTPKTAALMETEGVRIVQTSGKGYIEDMREAIVKIHLSEPVLVISADIPLITHAILRYIVSVYYQTENPALAVYTTKKFCNIHGIEKREEICPTGINIVSGSGILENPEAIQSEYRLIIDRIEVALNVNAVRDLELLQEECSQDL
jgi:adenosylcobinamide-phosphate guanylyltransferase